MYLYIQKRQGVAVVATREDQLYKHDPLGRNMLAKSEEARILMGTGDKGHWQWGKGLFVKLIFIVRHNHQNILELLFTSS